MWHFVVHCDLEDGSLFTLSQPVSDIFDGVRGRGPSSNIYVISIIFSIPLRHLAPPLRGVCKIQQQLNATQFCGTNLRSNAFN